MPRRRQPIIDTTPEKPVQVWTERLVAILALLPGFPAALGLAVINWLRMQRDGKALVHGIAWLLLAVALATCILWLPDVFWIIYLTLNLLLAIILYFELHNDIHQAEVAIASTWTGILSGIALLGLFLLVVLLFTILFTFVLPQSFFA